MMQDKRLIELFKSFVEKALLPQIKKLDGSVQEWKKFSFMISQESINYQELSSYVDSFGGSSNTIPTLEKTNLPIAFKRQLESQSSPQQYSGGFNPSKTVGGERARMALFNKLEAQVQERKFDSYKDSSSIARVQQASSQHSFAIDRLIKNFGDYHSKIEQSLNSIPEQNYGGKVLYR